jgi:serine/threonine protein kinase
MHRDVKPENFLISP